MTDFFNEAPIYSEDVDISDMDDCDYENKSSSRIDSTHWSMMDTEEQTESQPNQNENKGDSAAKIRKKPGRKPNPASSILRKAQNRAAQKAFRERREKHMKDLEIDIRKIREQKNKLIQENNELKTENDTLKAEKWYLKGIVLSLQLVCLQHNLVIPQHCPHVNDQALSVLAQSIPESISSYLSVNAKSKLHISQRIVNGSTETINISPQTPILPPTPKVNLDSNHRDNGNTLLNSKDINRLYNNSKQSSHNNGNKNDWWHQTNEINSYNVQSSHHSQDGLSMPALSPTLDKELDESPSSGTENENSDQYDLRGMNQIPASLQSQAESTLSSNLSAVQILRLRLRLQSSCVSVRTAPFTIQPTLLQLTIPHDPRIDLIPTPHMRDRMILYRDQFDLDDCFRLLLGSSVYHGGDPAIAGNWELPAEFFEKYWFLTIDYNLRRCTNEWRKKQGLQELKSNIQLKPAENSFFSSSSSSSSSMSVYQPNGFQPPQEKPLSTTENVDGYSQPLYGQPITNNSPESKPQSLPSQKSSKIEPIKLTNGYKMPNPIIQNMNLMSPYLNPSQQQDMETLLTSKNHNVLITGLYNNHHNFT